MPIFQKDKTTEVVSEQTLIAIQDHIENISALLSLQPTNTSTNEAIKALLDDYGLTRETFNTAIEKLKKEGKGQKFR